jgi:hypothetical protein
MAQQQVHVQPRKQKPGDDDEDQEAPIEVNEVSARVSERAAEWLRQNP